MIFQRPFGRSRFAATAIWVIWCGIEGVVANLTYLFGREKTLEEPGVIYISLEVILSRLVSSYAETTRTGLESTRRNGAVALSIYEISNTLADWVAHDGHVLPCAWLEGTRRCPALTAAQETIVEEGGCAATHWSFGTGIQIDASRTGIILLSKNDFVAIISTIFYLIVFIRSLCVLVVNPRTKGGLRDSRVENTCCIQIEILGITIQVECPSHFSFAIRNVVGTGSKRVLGRRGIGCAVVKRIMEDEFGLCFGNLLGDTQSYTLSPSVPKALHLAHLLGILGCHIIGFRKVVCEVEELPAAIGEGCKPPIAFADSFSSLVLPIKSTFFIPTLLVLKQWHETASLVAKRLDAIVIIGRGIGGAGQLQTSRHHIQEGARLRHDGSFLVFGHACRPMNDGRRCRSSMELCGLPISIRRIDCSCPTGMKIVVSKLTTRIRRVVHDHLPAACAVVPVKFAYRVVLGRSSVVGSENDEGIVEDVSTLQLRDDTTDILIHTVHHGSMHLHVCRLECLVGLVLPFASRSIRGNRHLIGIDKTEFQHTLVATLSEHIPPVVELAFILRYILGLGMKRPMRLLKSHIHEEGLAVRGHFIHHLYCLICHEICIVEILGNAVREDRFLVMNKGEGIEVVGNAPDGAPMLLETSVAGIGLYGSKRTVIEGTLMGEPLHLVCLVADACCEREMPFAAHSGMITYFAKHFRNGNAVARKALSHAGNAHGLGIATCQELSSRGTTAARVVELSEAHTRRGKRIQVGALNLAAKATEVRVAHVVNNNKHDVGALRLFLGVSHQGKQGRQGKLIFFHHSQIKLYLLYLLGVIIIRHLLFHVSVFGT